MTYPGRTESELRQQLREAWSQIGELQWQLQAEQRNSRRQDRRLESQEANFSESRNEHEQALADRDQDFADLEDEHHDIVTALQNERRDEAQAQLEGLGAQQRHSGSQRIGLKVLGDLLHGSALQSNNIERTAELEEWERCVRLAIDVEDQLDGRPAGRMELEAILRRVLSVQDATCVRSCAVQVDLDGSINPRQAILCAWLIDVWLRHACRPHDGSPTLRLSGRSVEAQLEMCMSVPLPDVASTPEPKLWRRALQAVVTALRGEFRDEIGSGITVAFPGMPHG